MQMDNYKGYALVGQDKYKKQNSNTSTREDLKIVL